MFKNMLKRSILSIRRKVGRTVVLVLIFFMMANLVLASITIKTAVGAQMDYAKSTLGGTVTIQADMEAMRSEQREKIEQGGDKREMFSQMKRPSVSVETANEIASYTEYVRDYSYQLSASANSYNLEVVEDTKPSFGPGMSMGGRGFGFGSSSDEEDTLDADITISGVNAYAYIDGVDNDSFEIKDGDYFDEDSEDAVMISYEFAELNDLSVGDEVKVKNIYTGKSVHLKVIGIYDTSDEMANANVMYMNTATAAKFLSEDDYNDGNFDVQNVNYYMLDSGLADEFVERINATFPELAENKMKIAVDTSEYDAMAGSIESVGSFATTILVIVIVAAVIIITLIVTINVKDRNYEMGVLLSLGATKRNIMGQIATELIVVGTFGFALACLSGTVLAKTMGDGILQSQISSTQQQMEKNFGRPGTQIGGQGGPDGMGTPGQGGQGSSQGGQGFGPGGNMPDMAMNNPMRKNAVAQNTEVELNINATPIDFVLLFVTGYLVVVFALILPSVNILRYQPKQILAGKE